MKSIQLRSMNQIIIHRDTPLAKKNPPFYKLIATKRQYITRTWTWRGPHWSPKASYGRSSGVHPTPSAKLFRPPGTGETANTTIHKNRSILYMSKYTYKLITLSVPIRERERERLGSYLECHHFRRSEFFFLSWSNSEADVGFCDSRLWVGRQKP